jgi:predicted TPR repeat methyltransferase
MKGRKPKSGKKNGPQDRIRAAIAAHRSGNLDEAEKVYLAVLETQPDNVDALHYLGLLAHQRGRPARAIDLIVRALELDPTYFDALNNLGNIYLRSDAAAAIDLYNRALELRPDHPEATRNLGIALGRLKRHEEAAELYERSIRERPDHLDSYYSLSVVYKDLDRYDDALATLRRAIAIKPEAEGFRRLGPMLYGLGRIEEAAGVYEAWLRADPGNPVASHMLAACTSKEVPARAADAFVTRVFDGFAESFDEVLMHRLEYRAPELVGEALRRGAGEPRGDLDIVDAGCGTGLLAEYLKPYARRLVGVDLSSKMLAKAARRPYNWLVVHELATFLDLMPRSFDVVASSDTLVYFGDLREVLAAAGRSLREGGRLFLTLEHAADEAEVPAGYRIHPHGRYSHTEPYVRGTLAQAGFEAIEIDKAHLRREGSTYVEGLVVSARRKSGESALALHRQGRLEHQRGRSLSAHDLVRRSIELDPASSAAYNDLGDIYRSLGSPASAVKAYNRALELRPDHPEAARSLAAVTEKLRRLEASAEAHRRAIERAPADADALYALAADYKEMGGIEEAVEILKKALQVRPEWEGFRELGALQYAIGRIADVVETYEAWLRTEPGNAVARHLLAACTGKNVPARASDAFVTLDFDRFADTFDAKLEGLEYRAPALIGEALRRSAGEPRGDLEILDAGCGTGLLGQYLRPYARRLVGVDLSRKMLEKAARLSLYDGLVVAELASFLRASPGGFDIVASSDTLVYFGELGEVFAAARRSLRPSGMLVFTLEREANAAETPTGYRIHPHGRYSHTELYVRSALAEAGFEAVEIEKANLRREGERYVDGLVIVARAAESPRRGQ